MKLDLHPTIYPKARTTCTACGAVFLIPGTKEEITIEICSQCHPVYTGKFRGVISSGRVERFQKKLAAAKKVKSEAKPRKRLTSEEKIEQKLEEKRAEKAVQEEKKVEKAKKDAAATIKKVPAKKVTTAKAKTATKKKKKK